MYAIEFEADVQNGLIKIPSQYKELDSKHLKIIALLDDSETIKPMQENQQFTDEYINDHWRELLMTGLSNYDEAYYKSDQYKEDRGNYLMEKYK
ncbi:MAG: hypothetical protein WCS87_17365 [Methylococcaceae bacterium]